MVTEQPASEIKRRKRLLLIEDEASFREGLQQALQLAGFDVLAFPMAKPAVDALPSADIDVVLTDLRMPNMDGLEVLRCCRQADGDLPVVLMTGHADIPTAVQAIQNGAYDFLEKPFGRDRLVTLLRRATEQRDLAVENRSLRGRLAESGGLNEALRGDSAPMRDLRDRVIRVAPTVADVLVCGETGTGKEVVARALHDFSGRKGPFVAVNCAAVPEALFESELFGHQAGAFTGAIKRRVGKIEHASGGTLFLDEIEAMPLPLQAKLLRVLQEREVEPLGSNHAVQVDLRVVAATNSSLTRMVADGQFRMDLFYRLNVVTLELPALRDRRGDIPLLLEHFLQLAVRRFQLPRVEPTLEVRETLLAHAWPGNVRELKSAAERLVLGVPPLAGAVESAASGAGRSLGTVLESIERVLIEDALRRHQGNVTRAGDELQINQATLYRKLKLHNLQPDQYRNQR